MVGGIHPHGRWVRGAPAPPAPPVFLFLFFPARPPPLTPRAEHSPGDQKRSAQLPAAARSSWSPKLCVPREHPLYVGFRQSGNLYSEKISVELQLCDRYSTCDTEFSQ